MFGLGLELRLGLGLTGLGLCGLDYITAGTPTTPVYTQNNTPYNLAVPPRATYASPVACRLQWNTSIRPQFMQCSE